MTSLPGNTGRRAGERPCGGVTLIFKVVSDDHFPGCELTRMPPFLLSWRKNRPVKGIK
jgi:hypothetical protein